jgi:hypothetical protein
MSLLPKVLSIGGDFIKLLIGGTKLEDIIKACHINMPVRRDKPPAKRSQFLFAGGYTTATNYRQSFLVFEWNLFRFRFLMAWVLFHFHEVNDLIYFIGIVVIFSGLGRLYSRVKVGSAGKYFDYMMVIEIALGIAIILLQYFKYQ